MPIYEYECTCCSARFELKQSFSEEASACCPRCGSTARRIFSPTPIIFKGSGFYSTDHGGNHGHSEPAADTGESKAVSTEEKSKTASAEGKSKVASTEEKSKAASAEEKSKTASTKEKSKAGSSEEKK